MLGQIFVVDDEPLMLPFIASALRKAGYAVWQATSPKEALEMVAKGLPPMDLLLADVLMPKLTGPQLSEHLLEVFPKMKTLYMTGLTEDYLRAIGIEVPRDKVIHKPFGSKALVSRIAMSLDLPLDVTLPSPASEDKPSMNFADLFDASKKSSVFSVSELVAHEEGDDTTDRTKSHP